MKFSKIIGKIDEKLVSQAEDRLSQIFLELATKYENTFVGSGMGGDALIFSLMYPVEHVCTLNMPTAATDGRRFYFNPKFVLKQSKIGLRIICSHEAWHALYLHPQRRGSRLPKLWNIAVDYIVNGTVMEDFRARKMNPGDMFAKHLGRFMTLPQYAEMLKDPFAKVPGFDDLNITENNSSKVSLPSPDEDRELTPEEQKELERREKPVKFYYADPDLTEEMKSPERIYDFLYNLLPKCPKCGSVGIYKNPNKGKGKGKGNGSGSGDKDKKDKHEHGDGQKCDCPDHQGDDQKDGEGNGPGCDCGDGVDIFGLGGLVDDHMDTSETPEKLAKRISDAMEAARKMAGHIPAALEDELGKLTAPIIRWQDIIRTRIKKSQTGNSRSDWTRFRSRPMFSGQLVPKRKSYHCQFGCLLDSSGSMSKDDMARGVSQLQGLDEKGECVLCFADATIYWDKIIKLKRFKEEDLMKIKPIGGGGTVWASYFRDYEKHIGKCDFLIIMSDLYLMDTDVAEMQDPGIPVYWLCTSDNHSFNAPFGKILHLNG